MTALGVNTVPLLRGRTGSIVVALKDAPVIPWRYDLGSGEAGAERVEQGPADAAPFSFPGRGFGKPAYSCPRRAPAGYFAVWMFT